jgi:methyltransferase (TIGR00027 family)
MNENQVSLTALLTAYVRAYHARNDQPRIFDDFLAYNLFTEEEFKNLGHNLAESLNFFNPERAASCPDQATALACVIQTMMSPTLSRSRYTEDTLESAIKSGVQQYVILGSGMDTFAFRRPELLKQIHVFEVDHPATQYYKLNRLKELGWELPPQLHYVPVDFTKDNLMTALKQSSYTQALSFFSWLGVSLYLTREVVFDTLRTIANLAPKGSTIVFDYIDNDAFSPEKSTKRVQLVQEIVQRVGEPMKAGLNPSTLADDLKSLGWLLMENLNPSDLEKRYFQGRVDEYHAFDYIHYAQAMIL